jgi:hypothetical protein
LQLGLGVKAIEWRAKQGRLIRVHAGVYAVGHVPTLPLDRAFGAVLACGPEAVLSHSSAGSVWGIERLWQMPFEVTHANTRRRAGIRAHQAALAPEDLTRHHDVPVTSPARTLLDLAPRLSARQLERATDDLRVGGFMRLERLGEVVERYRRHPGASALGRVLESPHGPTRSDWELAFIDFIKRHDLPTPLINAKVGPYEVDALFPAERVIVELDSWKHHQTRTSFRNDRRRDGLTLSWGYVTIRITWERLEDEPEREAEQLKAILDQRRRFLRSPGELLTGL